MGEEGARPRLTFAQARALQRQFTSAAAIAPLAKKNKETYVHSIERLAPLRKVAFGLALLALRSNPMPHIGLSIQKIAMGSA